MVIKMSAVKLGDFAHHILTVIIREMKNSASDWSLPMIYFFILYRSEDKDKEWSKFIIF